MAGDVNSGLDAAAKSVSSMADDSDRLKSNFEKIAGFADKLRGAGSSSQVANRGAPTNNGGSGAPGGGGTGGGGGSPYQASTAGDTPRFTNGSANFYRLMGNVGGAAIGAMSFLPTSQEAVMTQQLADRIKFYSGNQQSFGTNQKVGYNMQQRFSAAGSALNPMDAGAAINAGVGMGLLPGLSNYNTGANTDTTRYSGVLGGAALASNLNPGIGLQGGMAAMGSLNQAQNVNMLRMLGVQVRNSSGTGMNDLPSIIEQIYKLLSQGKSITVKDIAVSMQPGNALDSLLNQYFGGDQNLKQVVLSGLVQMANNGGTSLRTSGTKEMLAKSGGLTGAVTSTGNRSTAELGLIQSFAERTANQTVNANNFLQSTYGTFANSTGPLRAGLNKGQDLSTFLGTFAGARGGGGQAILENLNGIAGTAFGSGGVGKLLSGIGLLAGAAALPSGASSSPNAAGPANANDLSFMPTAASNSGPLYTGAITVNVTAPPSSDPYSYGLAISSALTARS